MIRGNYIPYTIARIWITFIVLLSILGLFIHFFAANKSYELPGSAQPTVRQLQYIYDSTDKDWFWGRLPYNTVVIYGPSDGNIGETYYLRGHFTIVLNPKYINCQRHAYQVIFHESCHIKEWNSKEKDKHGRDFQMCMFDLASRGAFHNIW